MTLMKDFINRFSDQIKAAITTFKKYTSKLTPKDDWVEPLRRRILVALDPIFRPLGRNLIFHCHDEDFMYRVNKDSDAVERALDNGEYQRNLTSTRKYRYIDNAGNPIPKGRESDEKTRQWADGSWVLDPDDTEWQHHVYLFDTGSLGQEKCDIYGHKEASTTNPEEHHRSWQKHGDPDENVVPLLANAGIRRVEYNYNYT